MNKFLDLLQKGWYEFIQILFAPPELVSLAPAGVARGRVLFSFMLEGFLMKPGAPLVNCHFNLWHSRQMAQTFLSHGFVVDIISWNNLAFVPTRRYDYVIDIHSNLERLTPFLNKDCVKILHITGCHWLFQNRAEYTRLLSLQQRKGVVLVPRKLSLSSKAIELADYVTTIGNRFTVNTFSYARKPISQLPNAVNVLCPWPEQKDFAACRGRFIWVGGGGMVHKGLDLVLEAFVRMPEYALTVCGPVKEEKDFEETYAKELYQTPNIHVAGAIRLDTAEFLQLAQSCVAVVVPSCSEANCGSVIQCMNAGLIPMITPETAVDVEDFGFLLQEPTVEEVERGVRHVASLPASEIKSRSRKSWEYIRTYHTRERFAVEYERFVAELLNANR